MWQTYDQCGTSKPKPHMSMTLQIIQLTYYLVPHHRLQLYLGPITSFNYILVSITIFNYILVCITTFKHVIKILINIYFIIMGTWSRDMLKRLGTSRGWNPKGLDKSLAKGLAWILIDHGFFHKMLGFFCTHGFVEIVVQSISTPRATQHKSFGPCMKFHTLVLIFTKMGSLLLTWVACLSKCPYLHHAYRPSFASLEEAFT